MFSLLTFAALLSTTEECRSFLDQAQRALSVSNYQAAAAAFDLAAARCDGSVDVLLGLAQARLKLRQFDAALDAVRRALTRDPANVAALKISGDILYLTGKDFEAEAALERSLVIDPNHEESHYALGRILYQQDRYPEAVLHFQKVIELQPKSYRAHDNIALCYEAMNQDSNALKHYFKALDLVYKDHPEYDWVYGNLANFFLRRNENEKAFKLAGEAARRNPRSPRNFFLTGKALFKLEQVDQSVKWLKRATELDPAYPEPRYLLGQIYRRQGLVEEANREMGVFRELSKTQRPRR